MTAAEKYVAGAYLVAFLTVLAYVLIIALKLARLEQALAEGEAAVSATSSLPETGKATRTDRRYPPAAARLRPRPPPATRQRSTTEEE